MTTASPRPRAAAADRRTAAARALGAVDYAVEHWETDGADVRATAPYTTNQTLVLEDGVVELGAAHAARRPRV